MNKPLRNPFRPDVAIRDDNGKKTATLRYRTLAQMTDALDWANDDDNDNGRAKSCREESGESPWSGTNTADEYIGMLRDGWKHGVQDVEGLDGLSSDRAEKLTFVRDVGGVFPIIPAYLAGVPDNMLSVRPMPSDAVRGLTLVIDSSFHAGVRGDTVLEYARNVMKLIAWLQAEQIDTSIYVVCPIQFGQRRIIYTTPIRETGDVLQPERIAAVIHPSWLRRAWFAMVEREYYEYGMKECQTCLGGFGQVRHVNADEMRQVLPEAYSVIMLPKVGSGNPMAAVRESISLKLRQGDAS